MPTSTLESEILTLKQVADYLKVTERTMYRLDALKKIPEFRVGGIWRFSRVDLKGWIKEQARKGCPTSFDRESTADKKIRKWRV